MLGEELDELESFEVHAEPVPLGVVDELVDNCASLSFSLIETLHHPHFITLIKTLHHTAPLCLLLLKHCTTLTSSLLLRHCITLHHSVFLSY